MILILEGISKCGKTSWYERNLPRLQQKYGRVGYFHPLTTPVGAMVRALYMNGETSHQELTGLFTGVHLASLGEIESRHKRYDMLVLDRSLITTLAVNMPALIQHMEAVGGQFHGEDFDSALHTISHLYLQTLQYFTHNNVKLLWFTCEEPRDRYAAMFHVNDKYRREVEMASPPIPGRDIYRIDASETIEMVDSSFASKELLG
jgi:hypothetical protein